MPAYLSDISPGRAKRFFCPPKRPDWLCCPPKRPDWLGCPPCFLFNDYSVYYPWGQSGRRIELTTRFHLVLRYSMSGVTLIVRISLCGQVQIISTFFFCTSNFEMKMHISVRNYIKKTSVALVRKGNIPTERPSPVGEVSANFCG